MIHEALPEEPNVFLMERKGFHSLVRVGLVACLDELQPEETIRGTLLIDLLRQRAEEVILLAERQLATFDEREDASELLRGDDGREPSAAESVLRAATGATEALAGPLDIAEDEEDRENYNEQETAAEPGEGGWITHPAR